MEFIEEPGNNIYFLKDWQCLVAWRKGLLTVHDGGEYVSYKRMENLRPRFLLEDMRRPEGLINHINDTDEARVQELLEILVRNRKLDTMAALAIKRIWEMKDNGE